MASVCFYFQVHQPYRLRRYSVFDTDRHYFDDNKNAEICRKVAHKCYLPANRMLLDTIRVHEGRFKIAFSLTGVALEQFQRYAPEVMDTFHQLNETGCVEFLAETYYHSLAFLFSEDEFRRQVKQHKAKVRQLFGVIPKTLRNTELIYDNRFGRTARELGFKVVLAEGAERILDWRSPNFVYRPHGVDGVSLLLKNYRLSDDIAFRFSNRDWDGWPLTAKKYADWLHQFAGNAQTINLFMDYETFGEHQWKETGIFDFLRHLPEAVLAHKDFRFLTPAEVAKKYKPVGELDVPQPVSWADTERDLSAWLGNHMQDGAAEMLYGLEKELMGLKDPELLHLWRKLQTSDHFYYMCTKYYHDGVVHKYFSPYASPYDSFIHYANALNQLKWMLGEARRRRDDARRAARAASTAEAAARRRQAALPVRPARPALPSRASAETESHVPYMVAAAPH